MIHDTRRSTLWLCCFPRGSTSMSEKLHPHVPKSIEIKEALGRLTPEERIYILGAPACWRPSARRWRRRSGV